ncbi:nuclear transport factor 2 family protein [Sphingomonas sp. PAMC26645]|uniref:nuclear transport factor 2 family protein n=1 Tax=Sphingomonas sp. PAMC26645 TaxID=2565555 RepID=UPI00109DE84B|nr:nuclear transport factor 2 family protein [Sphingomonas sp. PAMC26645]QCB41679.1 nuclear transport factor 2 family protein [Sphingomonas sp. PAMC26645]
MRVFLGIASASLVSVPVAAQSVEVDIQKLGQRAEAFVRVRNQFDQAAMNAMMAPEYQEVSPVGEVDSRERVIGFYAADKKSAAPPMTITETVARPAGTIGVVTMRIAYTMPGKDGQMQTRALRAGFVARRIKGDWQFVSLQFTPIRG